MPTQSSTGFVPLYGDQACTLPGRKVFRTTCRRRQTPASVGSTAGFALVELLVVMAIIGTLAGLILPAISQARETARKTECVNNLQQMTLGVCAYESARRVFPPGVDAIPAGDALPYGTQHAWSSFILPYIEEQVLASTINYKASWNGPGANALASDHTIPLYTCPSGAVTYAGKQDYGGIYGTHIIPSGAEAPAANPSSNGIMVAALAPSRWGLSRSQITDGLSQTLLIGEAVDRGHSVDTAATYDENIRWAWGTNTFAQNASFVNIFTEQGIRSNHLGGAYASFADGRCKFLNETMHPDVLAAICTRNGGETLTAEQN